MKGLTERQRGIYEMILDHFAENLAMPTIRELAHKDGTTPKNVQDHMVALSKKGYLVRSEENYASSRGIIVANKLDLLSAIATKYRDDLKVVMNGTRK